MSLSPTQTPAPLPTGEGGIGAGQTTGRGATSPALRPVSVLRHGDVSAVVWERPVVRPVEVVGGVEYLLPRRWGK